MTAPSPVHLTLRHRALSLQRRRFWREFSYGAILVLADILTLAIVFSVLSTLPIDKLDPAMGVGGEAFVRGLIPQTGLALGRRVTSLLFCLVVTGSYADTERKAHPGRMAAALLLGLVLPRWVEIWQSALPARWLLLGIVLAATWVTLVLQRSALVRALKSIDPRRLERTRTLIVGRAIDVQAIAGAEDKARDPSPMPTFVLSASWPNGTTESMRELYTALAEWDADAIVLVGPVTDPALQAVMIAASSAGASVYATRREAFRQLDEPSFVLRRAEPIAVLSRPALVGSQLVVKRVVDLAGAAVGLVVLSPVFFLASLAIRLTSRGPVLFRQVRVGLGGDPFVMMKFRTMVDDAEHQLAELQQANVYSTEPLFKLEKDPRMTPIGVFLRKSSLDELPQLLNVLRGEMSLVGPRPALPSEVRRYQQHHFVRFEVLPGITGPWQVSGRNSITSFEDVVQLESSYIRGWTVWRDLAILARTVPAVFSMKGAF